MNTIKTLKDNKISRWMKKNVKHRMEKNMIKTNYQLKKERLIIKLIKNEDFHENFLKLGNIYTLHLVSENDDHVLFKIKKFDSFWKMSHGTLDVDEVLTNSICEKIVEYDKFKNETSLKTYIKTVCNIIESE